MAAQNVQIGVVWALRGHSRSSAMSPFDTAHTTSYSTLIHRESKKQDTKLLAITHYYPIFKIFSLADSVVNLQQTHCLNIPPRFKRVATLPCEI